MNNYTKDYKDDNLWLMFGDCLERMKEIPDGSVDMVFATCSHYCFVLQCA